VLRYTMRHAQKIQASLDQRLQIGRGIFFFKIYWRKR